MRGRFDFYHLPAIGSGFHNLVIGIAGSEVVIAVQVGSALFVAAECVRGDFAIVIIELENGLAILGDDSPGTRAPAASQSSKDPFGQVRYKRTVNPKQLSLIFFSTQFDYFRNFSQIIF